MSWAIRGFRTLRLALYLALVLAALAAPVVAHAKTTAPADRAYLLHVNGDIDPNHARYLRSSLDRAQRDGGQFAIIEIDTPGGDLDSMRDMVKHILASKIPVVTFVGPSGARAGSAGTFVTVAGHIAAMAPGTNIGAATPISGTGEDLPATLANKVTNDAAALIRSLATLYGRNADKLEATVRQATSYTVQEAIDSHIVDMTANGLNDLLAKLDGRVVSITGNQVTLHTAGIACEKPRTNCADLNLNWVQRIINFISDPNVSGLLLTLGSLGLLIELFNPGLIFPGIFGAIALALAFVSFGNLPVNYAGVGLVMFAALLFLLELHFSGHGILGVGSIISFIIGIILLFEPFAADPPNISGPSLRVSFWLVGTLGAAFAAAVAAIVFLAWRSPRAPVMAGPHPLVGQMGVVTRTLDPTGTVQAGGELWTARAAAGERVAEGEPVRIIKTDGLTLIVEPERPPSEPEARPDWPSQS
ncbi:MAG: nodulation protein NfeD [Chloroflexi bacterium]|nr:nodulation protein NfeD [Chloroflexota bacterium]